MVEFKSDFGLAVGVLGVLEDLLGDDDVGVAEGFFGFDDDAGDALIDDLESFATREFVDVEEDGRVPGLFCLIVRVIESVEDRFGIVDEVMIDGLVVGLVVCERRNGSALFWFPLLKAGLGY